MEGDQRNGKGFTGLKKGYPVIVTPGPDQKSWRGIEEHPVTTIRVKKKRCVSVPEYPVRYNPEGNQKSVMILN